MEANHSVAPRLPALKQIGQIGVEAAHIGTAYGLGIGGSLQPIADSALTNAHPLGNSCLAHPKFAQSHYLLIAGQAFLSIGLLQTLHLGGTFQSPGRMFYGKVLFKRFLYFLLAFGRQMASKKSFQHLSQIFRAPWNLSARLPGLRGTGDGGRGIVSSPVPAYHLDFWMLSHPGRSRLCIAVRQKIKDAMGGEVDKKRAEL